MKAVLQFDASSRLKARLAQISDPRIVVVDEGDEAEFLFEMQNAEVLLHVLKPVTAAVIAAAPKLKLIQKIGVGVNTIDRAAAHRAGVAIANMPGTNTQAVAEHTLALILATLRKLSFFDTPTRRGIGWNLSPESTEALGEISGRRIGFIGFGAVPQRLAPALIALGADVRYWTRSGSQSDMAPYMEFDELLETSDIVSLHIPATPDTTGMINQTAIRRMKPGAILINTARGELVNQEALAKALLEGRLSAAGLDVFSSEPATDLGQLAQCPSLIATPHIAWLTPETLERSLTIVLENCRRLSHSLPLLNEVRHE